MRFLLSAACACVVLSVGVAPAGATTPPAMPKLPTTFPGLPAILAGLPAILHSGFPAMGFPAIAHAGVPTVLRATLPSNEDFVVNGVSKLFTFTCKELRVQFQNGGAMDTANCQLPQGETPPPLIAFGSRAANYESDFVHVAGFAGPTVATKWFGFVTHTGNVFMMAFFAPPSP